MRLIRTWLARRRMAKLAEARRLCAEAYDAAVKRGDTREQHSAWIALKAATSDLIRHEIAFSMDRSRRARRAGAERLTVAGGSQ